MLLSRLASISYPTFQSSTLRPKKVFELTTMGVLKKMDSYSLLGSAILTLPEVVS